MGGQAPTPRSAAASAFPSHSTFFDESACLMGLMKTLDMEWQNVYCKGLDFAALNPARIVDELFDAALSYNEIGYSMDGHRFAVSMTSEPFSARNIKKSIVTPITNKDVFLVTGGARGITPCCLRELAKRV